MVFLCGMEDGLFPHQRSLNDIDGLEEERRLCLCRHDARDAAAVPDLRRAAPPARRGQLRRSRRVSSRKSPRNSSRKCARACRWRGRSPWAASAPAEPAVAGVRLGARVRHGKFGEGVILNVEGNGAHARVQVSFEQPGYQVADGAVRKPRAVYDSTPMKIVILGAGQVGRTAAHQLSREEANEVTVVDVNEDIAAGPSGSPRHPHRGGQRRLPLGAGSGGRGGSGHHRRPHQQR